jgi:hypothetical protein
MPLFAQSRKITPLPSTSAAQLGLATGRNKESVLVPVVFLVLPVTVLFALFPGLISIVSLAR